jgi:hypothetical protein
MELERKEKVAEQEIEIPENQSDQDENKMGPNIDDD